MHTLKNSLVKKNYIKGKCDLVLNSDIDKHSTFLIYS